jgi:dimethylargininase
MNHLCRRIIKPNIISSIHRRAHTTALTRKVPVSMNGALSMTTPASPVNIQKATSQHESYVDILREKVGIKTVEIEADNSHPDCVFIEDTAVVISNVAVITQIGAKSRRGEVDGVKDALLKLGIEVHDMRENGDGATLDGGDVLYPVDFNSDSSEEHDHQRGGHHLFVGISSRTNLQGIDYLVDKFPEVEVVPVDIEKMGSLHLKSIVTHLDYNTMLIPEGSLGNKISRAMGIEERGYNTIRLKDIAACNVVCVNGHVLAQPTKCKETRQILEREVESRNMNLIWVDASEFAKVDGALTCKSILL